jgi:hypothetical protein
MKAEGAVMERVEYRGWKNCWRISDGAVDLVVTTDVGPRIIRFGFTGGDNMFHESPSDLGKAGDSKWVSYGGHRLWHAPESNPRTYAPDNTSVSAEKKGSWLVISCPREESTGIRKEMHIRLTPAPSGEGKAEILHILINENLWAVELAPWAITVMAAGGSAVMPLPPRGRHEDNLLPTSSLATWAYTDMSDPRWSWLEKHIILRQDPQAKGPQKVGIRSPAGWLAYAVNGNLFAKKAAFLEGAIYPDMGCNVECFTNPVMLELETLGPLGRMEPGAAVQHREEWLLVKGVKPPSSDAEIDKLILPKL